MSETQIRHIWNPSIGITDLEGDSKGLAATEIPGIRATWRDQRDLLQGTKLLHDFDERLGREWAIETGVIENLYEVERGVTQTLIEQGFRAELLTHGSTNRPREFVLKLLADQKSALDGVFDFVKSDRILSTSWIRELHAVLLRSQEFTEGVDNFGRDVEISLIKGDWKNLPNSPVRGGVLYAYCPPEHVASEMDRLVAMHAEHDARGVPTEVQAAWLHHRFAQIHPFRDGNGRIARAIASLVLIKGGLFPLVVTRDDRTKYLGALEAADYGDLKPLVDLIARLQRVRFAKATAISEAIRSEKADEKEALAGLLEAVNKKADERRKEYAEVQERAEDIKENLRARLEEICPEVRNALRRVVNSGNANVWVADKETGHYYRAQIIQNAKEHLNYYVNFGQFRSWVSLNMWWERQARLVFAIHGIGYGFNGSLICAPFLEFRDKGEDEETRSTLAPVAEEGFIFFYNETKDAVLDRFRPWRRRVLGVALKELTRNL